jgi:hypothetical protein
MRNHRLRLAPVLRLVFVFHGIFSGTLAEWGRCVNRLVARLRDFQTWESHVAAIENPI